MEAGLVEFGLFGYSGASTARIAARAQVPQPHVYASFSAKRELFVACVSRACGAIEAALEHRLEAEDTLVDLPELIDPLRVLLQAVSAARDEALRADLRPMLQELRARVGETRFAALLAAAASAQLGEPGE